MSTLKNKNSSLQELPGILPRHNPGRVRLVLYNIVQNSLTRNQQLNLVNLLSAPPATQPHRPQRIAATMMLKLWHKAIIKLTAIPISEFTASPNNAGASAIFKLLTARPPQLLAKFLQRPTTATDPATAAASRKEHRKRQRF